MLRKILFRKRRCTKLELTAIQVINHSNGLACCSCQFNLDNQSLSEVQVIDFQAD